MLGGGSKKGWCGVEEAEPGIPQRVFTPSPSFLFFFFFLCVSVRLCDVMHPALALGTDDR